MSFEQSNQAFIIAAYAMTWGVILGYMLYLVRRSARVAADEARVGRGEER